MADTVSPYPRQITLESIADLTPAQRTHLHEIAGRLGFTIASASAPGKWRCELDGYWWFAV